MKIRIKGNSVRIRLTRSEVDNFARDGHVEELTEFGSGVFRYALQSKDGIKQLEAGFADGVITMYVPSEIASQWAANETVGYSNNMDIGSGKQLFLLLEKDFKCIDAPAYEDQSDNFEHPSLSCS